MIAEHAGTIVTVLVVAAGIVVWAVREEGKRETLKAALNARLDALEHRHAQGDARLLGTEARILAQLTRIEDKLDRKVDK
jgi:hypothetical protein